MWKFCKLNGLIMQQKNAKLCGHYAPKKRKFCKILNSKMKFMQNHCKEWPNNQAFSALFWMAIVNIKSMALDSLSTSQETLRYGFLSHLTKLYKNWNIIQIQRRPFWKSDLRFVISDPKNRRIRHFNVFDWVL